MIFIKQGNRIMRSRESRIDNFSTVRYTSDLSGELLDERKKRVTNLRKYYAEPKQRRRLEI